MAWLWLGVILFFAVHSVAMVPRLRAALRGRFGVDGWRGIHAIVAAVGLGLMIWGFARARAEGVAPWFEPRLGLRHATLLLMLPVFPLLIASGVDGRIRAVTRHPMLTGVVLWALAHLLVVGTAPAVAICGAFAVWGIADRVSLARRAGAAPAAPPPPFGRGDLVAVIGGIVLWAVFVLWLHQWLIGVAPLG